MDQGILGSIAKYEELTFKKALQQGFVWGVYDAAARQTTSASVPSNAIQTNDIIQLNAEYEENGLKLVIPECNSETMWRLDKVLDSKLRSYSESGNLHSTSHAAYFLIGYAAGQTYGGAPDKIVEDRICQINIFFRDANIKEKALYESIKQLPTPNQTVEDFLRALKQTLQSFHGRITILFLAACPDDDDKFDRIRSDREFRTLQETLNRSPFSEAFQLFDVKSCRLRDITGAIRRHRPSILHFSGHANKDGLVFEDDTGNYDFIETETLAMVMEQGAKYGLRTVFLNACSTAEQSDAIANLVGYVIAMKDAVYDNAAIDFVRAFYGALADGHNVDVAFDWGLAESKLISRKDMICPLLIRGGTKKSASEEAQKKSARKSDSLVPSKGQNGLSLAQSSGLINGDSDGKTTLADAEVDKEESEVTENEDESDSANEEVSREENQFKPILTSPSKPTAAPENPLASENTLVLQKAPASEESVSHMNRIIPPATGESPLALKSALDGPPNATIKQDPSPPKNASATIETTTKEKGIPSAANISPSTAEKQCLSMIEQLKLRSQIQNQGQNAEQKEIKPTTDSIPLQKPVASSKSTSNIQTPRESSPQIGNTPKPSVAQLRGAAAPAQRPNRSEVHRHPFFDDPFFTDPFGGGSVFNDIMFDGFFGPQRSAPPQARPSQGHGSNTTATRGGTTTTQIPPCDICNGPLTMEGGMTCKTCTNGKKFACRSCAPKLSCLQDKHEVYRVEWR